MNLYDYSTGELIREATEDEIAASDKAAARDGGVGAFEAEVDGEMITAYTN